MDMSLLFRSALVAVCCAGGFHRPAGGQIISGGGSVPAPPVTPTAASDERMRLATRFAEHFRAGNVGDAIAELVDTDALFTSMFGKDDWDESRPEEREEVARLYVEAMNIAHRRPAGEAPEPLQPGDMSLSESGPTAAKVGITFRVKNVPTRFVLRMQKKEDRWRVVDGYAVGEDSWADNIRKVYARFRGRTTPVACMRQVHELIVDVSRGEAATTRPGG
jgi:hypothetical protein